MSTSNPYAYRQHTLVPLASAHTNEYKLPLMNGLAQRYNALLQGLAQVHISAHRSSSKRVAVLEAVAMLRISAGPVLGQQQSAPH